MEMNGYRSIRLKNAMIEAIEKYIQEHPEMAYKSIADFISDAVREKMQELQRQGGGE